MTPAHDYGPGYTRSLPGQPCVIPCLLGLLRQQRQVKDIDQAEIVKKLPFPVNVREIENWETGQSTPAAGRVDVIVATYANLTGQRVEDFWTIAMYRATNHHALTGTGPHEAAMTMRFRQPDSFQVLAPGSQPTG